MNFTRSMMCPLRCCMNPEDKYKFSDIIWFDIAIGGYPSSTPKEVIGRIEFGLYGYLVPKTVKNFIRLSTCDEEGKSYKGSVIHRIDKGILIQGGEIVGSPNSRSTMNPTKSSSTSSSNTNSHNNQSHPTFFKDENFKVKHSHEGILSMANLSRPNTNGTQFFITLKPLPIFDGSHVAFGQVVSGMELLKQIEEVETYGHSPLIPVTIVDCGRKITSKSS